MEGTLDPFDFLLAEQLHRTVEEMRASISNREYHQQRAWWTYRESMAQLEAAKAGLPNGR